MFIRVTKSKNFQYINIVKTYRKDGKVKHKNIASLGRLDVLKNNKSWINIAKKLLEITGVKDCLIENKNDIKEKNRLHWGHKVYKKLWDKFDFSRMLKNLTKDKKIEYNFTEAVFKMVTDRLLTPQSKLATYEKQNQHIGLEKVDLHHFYRSLDLLSELKEDIEIAIFNKNINFFNMKIDVVFYDVTTLSFESQKSDELRQFGYSKDAKFNEVQVVFGLLVDKDARPIGFDVFPGSTFEGKTLEVALKKLKDRFNIDKVVVVADRGMNSKLNLQKIKAAGYDYIVGNRLRTSKKSLKEKMFNEDGYKELDSDFEKFRYKILENEFKIKDEVNKTHTLKDKIVVTWSSKRAEKDKKDRERLIEKAQVLVGNKSSITSGRGAKKYINIKLDGKPVLDEAKIKKDAKWDGFYSIQTSMKQFEAQEILSHYKHLWKIEESFRELKNTFEARPMFHWNPKRIQGHLVLCFIAFLLSRTLELKLKKNNVESCSALKIREALNSLQLSEIKVKKDSYYLKSSSNSLSKKILRIMKVKSPANLTPKKDFVI